MAKRTSVRLMVPFSMHCTSCSHFIYKSTKFNARKSSSGEQYLGIAIVRFSIRCPRCGGEIVFRTDPKTSGYIVISGADRNLEPWHDKAAEAESVDARLARLAGQYDGSESNEKDNGRDRGLELYSASSDSEPDAVDHKRRRRDHEDEDRQMTSVSSIDAGSSVISAEAAKLPPQPPKQIVTPDASAPPRKAKLPSPKKRKHLAKQPQS